jgi:hypothetical protein
MAVVSKNRYKPNHQRWPIRRILYGLIVITLVVAVWQMFFIGDSSSSLNHIEANLRSERVNYKKGKVARPVITSAIFDESDWDAKNKYIAAMKKIVPNSCGYTDGLNDLKPEELHPVAGKRHMITPPKDGKLSLVCCDTTKGPLALVVHRKFRIKFLMTMIEFDSFSFWKIYLLNKFNKSFCVQNKIQTTGHH